MTSTDNLITLLSQLQMMESTVTDFMMETILRFRYLTDAKVFLLIEKGGVELKRRYCGSPELLRQYESGSLSQHPGDDLVTLDATIPVLVNQQRNKRRLEDMTPSNDGAWSTSRDNHDVSPLKRNRTQKRTNDGSEMRIVNSEGGHMPQTETHHDSISFSSPPSHDIKIEIDDCVVLDDGDDDADQSEIYVDPEEEDASIASSLNVTVPEQFTSNDDVLKLLKEDDGLDQTGSGFFNRLSDSEAQEKKLAAILATDNPYAAYEKNTVQYKLWRSVLYTVGKNFALNCPFADGSLKNDAARVYFATRCEAFMQHCSALLVDKENRPGTADPQNDGLLGCTVAGFIRHSIRHGYVKILR